MVYIFGGDGFVGSHLVNAFDEKGIQYKVCDINNFHNNSNYLHIDITQEMDIYSLEFKDSDVIINLAANQYHNKVPKKNREFFFSSVNTIAAEKILKHAKNCNVKNVIIFSTDMVYGKPQCLPVPITHIRNPFGYYGRSKKAIEDIAFKYRDEGMNITIFRPRMIMGPGRLGILKKLFTLADKNLPLPMIGDGSNSYQMISVFDCVSAILLAMQYLDKNGSFPNKEYNLGSNNPPTVIDLLSSFAKEIGSKSKPLKTPALLVKFVLKVLGFIGLEIMYKEQYMIADENYLLDISETEQDLGWQPKFNDRDMIVQAYNMYKKGEEE